MNKKEAGRLGGLKTAQRYGSEYMRKIGKLGAATTWQRYKLVPVEIAAFAMVYRDTGAPRALINYYPR